MPTGITRVVNGVANWSIRTPFDVVVLIANQVSLTYTLTTGMQTLDLDNTLDVGTTTLGLVAASLTVLGAYGNTPYTLKLTIPFSEGAGTITKYDQFFTATAN